MYTTTSFVASCERVWGKNWYKTLTARALANSVSMGDAGRGKVTFFMRKGADCLWQLRLLFEQA
jgi:SpoVK/Ycf46/Vps4 family AAA+-type ATPase